MTQKNLIEQIQDKLAKEKLESIKKQITPLMRADLAFKQEIKEIENKISDNLEEISAIVEEADLSPEEVAKVLS